MYKEEGSFREQLEHVHSFPGRYTFKFIARREQENEVKKLIKDAKIKLKRSSGNKYISVTFYANMNTSDEVIEIYEEAKKN